MKRTLVTLWLVLAGAAVVARAADATFDFDVLQFRAKALAAKPYEEPKRDVPGWLMKLNYDQYRDIRFDEAHTWWREDRLPFQLQFFHPGGLFNKPVQIYEIVDHHERLIEFSPRLFHYGNDKPGGRVPSDLGFAGFRILYPMNSPDHFDEIVSFLGASYFRALGKDQRYGLSARGLALNTGETEGEEFPTFEEFWIERPAPGAKTITAYALLNGPSVAGAYRFIFAPGSDTVVLVKAAVYCRRNARTFGIAPLTSMFAHGENTGWAQDDFRPEVHDSDGLLVATGNGEWLWRPLTNPKQLRSVSFGTKNPLGFGLLQRDREFKHYDDLEAYYHQRPSAWVEPVGEWGNGAVRLIEIPTPDETNDNIVAFWVPAQLPPPGEPVTFEYKLHWFSDPAGRPPAGYTSSTRLASVRWHKEKDLKRFVIEFDGKYLNAAPAGPDMEAVVTVGAGGTQVEKSLVQKNAFTGAWRVVFEIKPDGSGRPVELRCFLRKGQHVLTETWSYLWNP
jgi:glucans biosynthesis protein